MCYTDKTCFTCLKKDVNELINISDEDGDSLTYIDKLKFCMNIELLQIGINEMCETCVGQLRVTYSFIEMVKASQESLQSYIEKRPHDLISDEEKDGVEDDEYEDKPITDGIYKCEFCGKECDTIYNLENHRLNVHISGTGHVCNYCHKVFKQLYQLNEHLRSHTEVEKYECTFCDKTFHRESSLRRHIRWHEKDGETKLNDTDQESLNKSDEETVISKTYNCKKCGQFSMTVLEHQEHKCADLKQVFHCDFCEMKFEKNWQRQKHRQRVHLAVKKYVCHYCNKAFKQSSHLREHVRAHTGEKNYECTYCDKKFHRLSSQRRHIRAHQAAPGEKTKKTPFLCSICGKSFPFSNGVQRHMRVHLGIKEHECNVCHRKFIQSTHLQVHMRTHTGEKPYVCHSCGAAFSLNSSLQKHMAGHYENNLKHETYNVFVELENVENT